jgi:hypothetical protein
VIIKQTTEVTDDVGHTNTVVCFYKDNEMRVYFNGLEIERQTNEYTLERQVKNLLDYMARCQDKIK